VPKTTAGPPVPSVAERAKTIATRGGQASIYPVGGGMDARTTPHLHHVYPSGTAILLLPDDHELVERARVGLEPALTALLELTDQAPVSLREPVRGLMWLTGSVHPLLGKQARAAALRVAEQRSDPRLLDVGHGASVLRLEPSAVVLADGDGTGSMQPEEFADAEADPFTCFESHWLRHLEYSHSDVVDVLRRYLPEELNAGQVRPLGLDRYGLRLRVEAVDGDHDIRLAFEEQVQTAPQLALQLRRLVGCPFSAQEAR
jgi:hypothetical protein